jgi:hypothetical protein
VRIDGGLDQHLAVLIQLPHATDFDVAFVLCVARVPEEFAHLRDDTRADELEQVYCQELCLGTSVTASVKFPVKLPGQYSFFLLFPKYAAEYYNIRNYAGQHAYVTILN